jgi:hypothetical protein
MSPDDHRECELHHRQRLGRVTELAEQLEQVEWEPRTIVDRLRDFRELLRPVTVRLRRLDDSVEHMLVARPTATQSLNGPPARRRILASWSSENESLPKTAKPDSGRESPTRRNSSWAKRTSSARC